MKLENEKFLIEEAVSGNQNALESLLCGVQDMVFNLSLRMLGTGSRRRRRDAGNSNKNHDAPSLFPSGKQPVNLGHADRDKPLAEFSKRDVLSRCPEF